MPADLTFQIILLAVGSILGGGGVLAFIEWRRFREEQRERRLREMEFDIQIIQAKIFVETWRISSSTPPSVRLYIYDNGLQDTVRSYSVLLEFTITNLSERELMVTNIDTFEPYIPNFPNFPLDPSLAEKMQADFTPEGIYYVVNEELGTIFWDVALKCALNKAERLTFDSYPSVPPKSNFGAAYVSHRSFFRDRRLDTAPNNITIQVSLADGKTAKKSVVLTSQVGEDIPPELLKYGIKSPKPVQHVH